MEKGDIVYIKATVTEDQSGTMVRCVTADSGEVIWCTEGDIVRPDEVSQCDGNRRAK